MAPSTVVTTVRNGKKVATHSVADLLKLPWVKFNERLMKVDEEVVVQLLRAEKKGARRLQVLLRIQSRLSRLRRERERKELVKFI